jgi:hypothetical protein
VHRRATRALWLSVFSGQSSGVAERIRAVPEQAPPIHVGDL